MRMKKMLAFLLASLLLLGSLLLFGGCGRSVSYENEEAYSVGSFKTTENVHAVKIYWDGRAVSVSAAYRNDISATEDYKGTDGKAMRYKIDGGVLEIYPASSGKSVEKLEKTLFLEIPMEMMMNSIDSFTIETVGDTKVNLQMMNAEDVSVTTEDGNVSVDGALSILNVKTEKGNLDVKSATVLSLDFTSITGDASLSLHLQGFTAVMRNENGSFTTDYAASENERIYTYGTQESVLTFMTEGNVTLRDYDIAQ